MSNSDIPRDAAQNLRAADNVKESKEDADMINKGKEILTKLESDFGALMNAIVGKFGHQLSELLKDSLECAICKEVIIESVSRPCAHTFCYHCFTNWLKQSNNCPICRDDECVGVKNPLMDAVIVLLVDLLFTEEERNERINIIQQRSTSSPSSEDEILVITDENKRIIETTSKDDLVLIGGLVCIRKAVYFLTDNVIGSEFQRQMRDAQEEDCADIMKLLSAFVSDYQQWHSILKSFPDSLNRRFLFY